MYQCRLIGLNDTVFLNSHLWSGIVCLEPELFALQEKLLNLFHPTSNVTLKLGNGVFRFKIFPKYSILIWVWKNLDNFNLKTHLALVLDKNIWANNTYITQFYFDKQAGKTTIKHKSIQRPTSNLIKMISRFTMCPPCTWCRRPPAGNPLWGFPRSKRARRPWENLWTTEDTGEALFWPEKN